MINNFTSIPSSLRTGTLLFIVLAGFLASCGSSQKYTYADRRNKQPSIDKKIKQRVRNGSVAVVDNKTDNLPDIKKEKVNVKKPKVNASKMKALAMVEEAEKFIGVPYKWGGADKGGMDCSGLMLTAYKAADMTLPHSCAMMSEMGSKIPVEASSIKVGDLVFFSWNSSTKPTHVGMVVEVVSDTEVRFIHASSSRGVTTDNMFSNYYGKHIVQVRRLLQKSS